MLGLEIGQNLVGQDEVEEEQTCAYECERVPPAVTEIVLFHLTVNGPRKEVENRADAWVVTHRSVSTLKKLPGKYERTLASCCMRESAELAKSEVAGMDGYDIEKASLRLGIAESFDSIDLFNRHFHGDKFSSVVSGSDLYSLAPRHTRSVSSMEWVLLSRSARRPSAGRDAWWFAQVIRVH